MIHQLWRLSENTPDNLGLACTEDGLLLGRTLLIERRDRRYVVRNRGDIARLLRRAYAGDPPVDRLMPGLLAVAAALNAGDQCLACIAAVHLKIPDLANFTARDALTSEDFLIKYARDEGDGEWDPALHPRAGVRPNPGWFAPTGGSQQQSSQEQSTQEQSNAVEPRQRFAANEDNSRSSDATSAGDDTASPTPGNPFDEPASFAERFGSSDTSATGQLWNQVWSGFKSWLQQPVPEYDLESGEKVGERPRWQAIAPYVGITAATAAVVGVEAFAPAVAAWLKAGGAAEFGASASAAEAGAGSGAAEAGAAVEGPKQIGTFVVREDIISKPVEFGIDAHMKIADVFAKLYRGATFIFRVGRGQNGVDVEVVEPEWIDAIGFRYAEIKPLSPWGESSFNQQVLNWDLPAPVQAIAYDKFGRIFWGFR